MKQNDERNEDTKTGEPQTGNAGEPQQGTEQAPATSDQGDGAGEGQQAQRDAPIEEEAVTK